MVESTQSITDTIDLEAKLTDSFDTPIQSLEHIKFDDNSNLNKYDFVVNQSVTQTPTLSILERLTQIEHMVQEMKKEEMEKIRKVTNNFRR